MESEFILFNKKYLHVTRSQENAKTKLILNVCKVNAF